MKKKLCWLIITTLSLGISFHSSHASDIDSIFVRAKSGLSFYSNTEPVSNAVGIGLDLGFRAENGLGTSVVTRLNFKNNGTLTPSTDTTSNITEVNSLYLGINPNYTFTSGIATLSFGFGVGILSVSTLEAISPDRTSTPLTDVKITRFALAPNVELDFEIYQNLYANVGLQHVLSFGDVSPRPNFILPTLGFSYKF
jgi:hypothetical protein